MHPCTPLATGLVSAADTIQFCVRHDRKATEGSERSLRVRHEGQYGFNIILVSGPDNDFRVTSFSA